MSKNYMKEVAQLLGVEMNKAFYIKGYTSDYYLTEEGLRSKNGYNCVNMLTELLIGGCTIEKSILNEKERKYLASVIEPKQIYKSVDYIVKNRAEERFYITIIYNKGFHAHLPCFTDENMYKGMEVNNRYTLEELGL